MNNTLKNYSKTFIQLMTRTLSIDEGRKRMPYRCSAGKLTFGIGHNIDDRGINPKVVKIQYKHMINSPADKNLDVSYNRPTNQVSVFTSIESMEFCDAAIDAQFQIDLNEALLDCERLYPNWHELHPKIRAVLANMCFQLGYSRLANFKNMNAAVVVGDFKTMAKEMLDSKWARDDSPKRANRLHKVVISDL